MKMKLTLLALLAFVLVPGVASAASVGVGGFGGVAIPILQDDNGTGSQFGVRFPVKLIPLFTVEPYFAHTAGGDATQGAFTRSGLNVNSFGVNAMLTFGSRFVTYPYVGVGSFKMSRTNMEDVSNAGYNFGLGVSLSPLPKLSLHVRGELAAAVDGDVSRKWANVTAGVSYDLFAFAGR